MSRVTKCICDGCGNEIEKEPVQIFAEIVDVETGDHLMYPGNHFHHDKKDYCTNCVQQIINFINGLPARNVGKPAVPNPDFEKAFKELRSAAKSVDTENKTEPTRQKQKQRKPTVREMIEAGKTTDEIVQATGCLRKSVGQIRYQINKKKQEAAPEEKEPEDHGDPSEPEPEAGDRQTVNCSKAMKTCEYAGKAGPTPICDYMSITGHSRGCPPEACTAYKRRGKK